MIPRYNSKLVKYSLASAAVNGMFPNTKPVDRLMKEPKSAPSNKPNIIWKQRNSSLPSTIHHTRDNSDFGDFDSLIEELTQ